MALANSLRIGSSANRAGLATMAFTSSSNRVLSPPLEDELGNKICCAPSGFTQRNTESDKIFGVHVIFPPS